MEKTIQNKKKTYLLSVQGKEEILFLESLLKKLKIKAKLLSDEEKEDIGLAMLMKQTNTSKTVSYEKVMKKLRG